jgi:hypothetical protein
MAHRSRPVPVAVQVVSCTSLGLAGQLTDRVRQTCDSMHRHTRRGVHVVAARERGDACVGLCFVCSRLADGLADGPVVGGTACPTLLVQCGLAWFTRLSSRQGPPQPARLLATLEGSAYETTRAGRVAPPDWWTGSLTGRPSPCLAGCWLPAWTSAGWPGEERGKARFGRFPRKVKRTGLEQRARAQ